MFKFFYAKTEFTFDTKIKDLTIYQDREQLLVSNQHISIINKSKHTQLLHSQNFIQRIFLDNLWL